MPQFHAPDLKVDATPVTNFLHDKSDFSFSQQLRGNNGGYHMRERPSLLSPLSSVTFFTLMLALHVLQNSLRGITITHSGSGVKISKPAKTATKGNGDPRVVENSQEASTVSYPRGPEINTFTNQILDRKYFQKNSSWGSKQKSDPNSGPKPTTEISAVVAKMPDLGLDPNWTSTEPIPVLSRGSKFKMEGQSKAKRSLSGRKDPLSQFQIPLPTIPYPIKHKIKRKRKKDPLLSNLEGLFWSILTHFLDFIFRL